MSWLVRFTVDESEAGRDQSSGDVDPTGDLIDDQEVLVSLLWDLGTTGIFQQPRRGRSEQAVLVAGFDDRALAQAAVALGAGHGLDATLDVVAPQWHSEDESEVTITGARGPVTFSVVAGPSFGHGSHPTTAASLDLLCELGRHRSSLGRVLDLGTGSGVLAIAAHQLGAESITAIDIDEAAVTAAKVNLSANGVEAECSTDSVEELAIRGNRFDTIVLNVLITVHEAVAPTIAQVLSPGGSLILSGILDHQLTRVITAYGQQRATLTESIVMQRGDWRAVLLVDRVSGLAG